MLTNRRFRRPGRGVSILVPQHFTDDDTERRANWVWLEKYWRAHFPAAEIIVGLDAQADDATPFSKAAAVNYAARLARSDIFIIADADCYLPADTTTEAIRLIREAREHHRRYWCLPYRRFYRLQPDITRLILRSNPAHPVFPADPPEPQQLQNINERASSHGHWFGALIQIMPAEAFWAIGGWDPAFRDWGGEDVSMMRCVDTIWARHRTLNSPVYHLWHPTHGDVSNTRTWAGGTPGANDWLSTLYDQAFGDPQRMQALRHRDEY